MPKKGDITRGKEKLFDYKLKKKLFFLIL